MATNANNRNVIDGTLTFSNPMGNVFPTTFIETVACTAIENPLTTPIPQGANIRAVLGNCAANLTGGGTTATWSIGVTGDVDRYGTAGYPAQADSLAKNSKSNWLGNDSANPAAGAVTLKICAAATGGASAGDTALTAGSVKVMVTYDMYIALPNV
jgi:hypothetical protein